MSLIYLPSLKIVLFLLPHLLVWHAMATRHGSIQSAGQCEKDQPAPAYLLKKRNLFCNKFVMAFLFE
jgi:hypothetical protein